MEIIGGIAIVILTLLGLYKLITLSDRRDELREQKFKHFIGSRRFREKIEKAGIQTWQHKTNELDRILKDVENDPKVQREIKESLELKKIVAVRKKEEDQRRNYFAFQNIEIIKAINEFKSPITKSEIEVLILKANLNLINVEKTIDELLENKIIEKDTKTELYKLSFYITEIYHPYELDENGEQRILFKLNFRGERVV